MTGAPNGRWGAATDGRAELADMTTKGGSAMRVVVTGGAGFIGSNLCRRLLASDGTQVVVLDDFSTGIRSNLDGLDARVVEGSILDDAALDEAFDGADAVVHLAARPSVQRSVDDPVSSHQANATGTLMVLEAARRHGDLHTVVASSSSVYGANTELPKHEGLKLDPMSPYAVSKLATESYTIAWQRTYRLPTLALRFFNVFGPRQPARSAYSAVIPAFVSAALEGRPVEIHGTGEQSRDFTYIDSVCGVITDALRRRVTSDTPVNLGFGVRMSLLEVLDELEAIVGGPVERRHVAARIGDVPHSQASGEELRRLFPDVAPVSVRTGLKETVAWFQSPDSDNPRISA